MSALIPKTKKGIRNDIYKLFEELSGKTMTVEQHEALKACVDSYIETEHTELVRVIKSMEQQSKKIQEMAKIVYEKGWDAEILEKHIGFLKKLYEATPPEQSLPT